MDRTIKWTNRVIIFSVLALVYWVFSAISIGVFGFKVFQQNTTELFFASIFGLIALIFGAAIANITANMTKISMALEKSENQSHKNVKKSIWGVVFLLALFPVIFVGLYSGDRYSSYLREKNIVDSARFLSDSRKPELTQMINYNHSISYIDSTARNLRLFESTEKKFPNISVILRTVINGRPTYISFDKRDDYERKVTVRDVVDYIAPTNEQERHYLDSVFEGKNTSYRFTSHDGKYELFYPVFIDDKAMILYFSDYQEFGKVSSGSY